MKRKKEDPVFKFRFPRLVAILVSIVALAAFFLPYISSTPEYAEYLEARGTEKVYESSDLTVGDMKEMSLVEYAKVYLQAGKEMYRDAATGIFYGVLIGLLAVFTLLELLFALGKKPVPLILFSLLTGGLFYLIEWDFADRGIMPNSDRVWGIAHQLYYPCAALLLICGIWMLTAKKKTKRQKKR